MAGWRVARIFVLGTLVLGLGTIVYRQGFGWQLGGAPAPLDTAYRTEEAWIAGEIVRDITEMSAYAADAPPGQTCRSRNHLAADATRSRRSPRSHNPSS